MALEGRCHEQLAALGFNVGLSGVGLEGNRNGQEGGWLMADGCSLAFRFAVWFPSAGERPIWLRSFYQRLRDCESGGPARSGSVARPKKGSIGDCRARTGKGVQPSCRPIRGHLHSCDDLRGARFPGRRRWPLRQQAKEEGEMLSPGAPTAAVARFRGRRCVLSFVLGMACCASLVGVTSCKVGFQKYGGVESLSPTV